VLPPEAELDPDLARLLSDPRLALRPPPPGLPLAEFRQAADGYLQRAPRPEVADVREVVIAGPGGPLPLRVYKPSPAPGAGAIVFIHGGGFTFGGLETHDGLCRRLALASGLTVTAVDYRLAPEHPFPAALLDGQAALRWVRTQLKPKRIALAGDSAGAQISIGLALSVGRSNVDALGLLYPLVDPDRATPSQQAYAQGYMLTGAFLEWSWSAYRGSSPATAADPLFDLPRADVSPLPPTTLVTAGYDPLRDEGLALAQRLAKAGVPLASRHYPDMIHGFAGLPRGSSRSEEAVTFLAESLREAVRTV
jgi:acetyl esterase